MNPAIDETPRCIKCYYVLEGLENPRCPECGRHFDLADPQTFTLRPPFLFWRFWLPGLVQAVVLGVIIFAGLLIAGSTGWALTIAAPVSVGALVAYKCRVGVVLLVVLVISAICGVVMMLVSADLSGILCGVISLAVLGLPALIGAMFGLGLRTTLKRSTFAQRSYLPIGLLLLLTPCVAVIEAIIDRDIPPESVVTSRVLPVDTKTAWGRLAFYEDLPQEKPWLLRWAGPVPVRTVTTTEGGDVTQTCFYEKGHLRKRVTDVRPERKLAFDVIEQKVGEERSVELLDGSFEFDSNGPATTRVTLTTRYRPRLSPRWIWRPFERLVNHQVHEHVLAGMAMGPAGSSSLVKAISKRAP